MHAQKEFIQQINFKQHKMKKLFLMMGLACLFMVACNNAPKQQEQTSEPQEEAVAEEHHCPFCPLKAEYAKWDEMDETMKAELNKKAFALFAEMDAKMAEMKAEGKECCEKAGEKEGCEKKMAEMTEEAKVECERKCAEMKAKMDVLMEKWANIENLSLDEQKDLVLERIAAMGMGKCNHEGEEGHKCQHEGEGHQCQHETK